MPFTPDFSVSQSLGFPSKINFSDDSIGSDGAIAARRIYLLDSEGEYDVEEGTATTYEVWPYADGTITLDLLDQDKAFLITIDWVNSSGTILYTKTYLRGFLLYLKTYYIGLIKAQSSRRKLIDHANFYQNEIKLLCSIQEATNAIDLAEDIGSAQAAMIRGKELIDNPSYFY